MYRVGFISQPNAFHSSLLPRLFFSIIAALASDGDVFVRLAICFTAFLPLCALLDICYKLGNDHETECLGTAVMNSGPTSVSIHVIIIRIYIYIGIYNICMYIYIYIHAHVSMIDTSQSPVIVRTVLMSEVLRRCFPLDGTTCDSHGRRRRGRPHWLRRRLDVSAGGQSRS